LHELLIFFDESEIVRAVLKEKKENATFYSDLKETIKVFTRNSFVIDIYYLNPSAIFFWGQMPHFQRAKSALKSSEIPLPDLIFRLRQKQFSGFIDVELVSNSDSGLLFFNKGERIGGSYSWSEGGMSKKDEDYNSLLNRVQTNEGIFKFGSYLSEKQIHEKTNSKGPSSSKKIKESTSLVTNPQSTPMKTGLEELLGLYVQILTEKGVPDPAHVLKEYIKSQLDSYPYLDSYMGYFEYNNETVKLSKDAPQEKIAKALVTCIWAIVRAYKVERGLEQKISTMQHKEIFEHSNIILKK
jgi:hypothetical protein